MMNINFKKGAALLAAILVLSGCTDYLEKEHERATDPCYDSGHDCGGDDGDDGDDGEIKPSTIHSSFNGDDFTIMWGVGNTSGSPLNLYISETTSISSVPPIASGDSGDIISINCVLDDEANGHKVYECASDGSSQNTTISVEDGLYLFVEQGVGGEPTSIGSINFSESGGSSSCSEEDGSSCPLSS